MRSGSAGDRRGGVVGAVVAAVGVVSLAVSLAAVPTAADATTTSVDCPAASISAHSSVAAYGGTAVETRGPVRVGLPAPSDALTGRLRAAVNHAVRFLVTSWWQGCYGRQAGPVVLGGTDEVHVRPAAAAAYTIAIAIRTGAYDQSVTGVSVATATRIATDLALGVAVHYRANDPAGWSAGWQSSHWADYAGTAAWMLWPRLSEDARQRVARMVAAEADMQAGKPAVARVPYYADRSGHVNTPGDTKAEENAWNAGVLSLAAVMMPTDPRAKRWSRVNVELLMSAFSRRADLTNRTIINGQAVSAWLNGYNVFDDGTLVNHGIIHPDYMSSVELNSHSSIHSGLAGQSAPRAATFGADKVYGALTRRVFAAPPFQAPGGTIYRSGSGDVYFPQGTDWGTGRAANFVDGDITAMASGYDTSGVAATWAGVHLGKVLREQARSTDGRSYLGHFSAAGSEDRYPGREQWVGATLAGAWVMNYLAYHRLLSVTNATVIVPGS
jgi:hypothetical protein